MAAKKEKTRFVCKDCGADFMRWQGQCSQCGGWNTIAEFKEAKLTTSGAKRAGAVGYAGEKATAPISLDDIPDHTEDSFLTGIGEFDRVCGNGITVASVNLISGDPGAGKTTLLSQVIGIMTKSMKCLYVNAEESLSQFRNRFVKRLDIPHKRDNIKVMSENNVDNIIRHAVEMEIKFLVVDSIQSVYSDDCNGDPGSISQVKGCAQRLTTLAKQHGITVFLVGHVNKSNEVAGPKTLIHIVDALFHIEVSDGDLRVIRPSKNRFGDVETVGLFRMLAKGMLPIDNPSRMFLSGGDTPTTGSAITCVRDGSRNLLLEIQSLVTPSSDDHVQRVCIGLNMNRLKMIGAILRKHGKLKLNHDIYVSLIGGIKLPETDASADLAIAASLYSSLKEVVLDRYCCFIGELSLSGEVRPVNGGIHRVKEAIKHGFTTIYIPQANYHKNMEQPGITLVGLKNVEQMLSCISS